MNANEERAAAGAMRAAANIGRALSSAEKDPAYTFTTGLEAGIYLARQHPVVASALCTFLDPLRDGGDERAAAGRDHAIQRIADAYTESL